MFAALLQESAMKESTPQGGCQSSKGTTGTSKFGQIVLVLAACNDCKCLTIASLDTARETDRPQADTDRQTD